MQLLKRPFNHLRSMLGTGSGTRIGIASLLLFEAVVLCRVILQETA